MPLTAENLVGLPCSFDHEGKRLTGTITAAKANGLTQRGGIPDWLVTVRGQSGRSITVSFVETYMSTPEPKETK